MGKVIICKSGQKIYVPELYVSGSLKTSHQTDDGLKVFAGTTYTQVYTDGTYMRDLDNSNPSGAINHEYSRLKGQITNLSIYASEEETDIIIGEGKYINIDRLVNTQCVGFTKQDTYGLHLTKSGNRVLWGGTYGSVFSNSVTSANPPYNFIIKKESELDITEYMPINSPLHIRPMIIEAVDSDGFRLLMLAHIAVINYGQTADFRTHYGAILDCIGAGSNNYDVDNPAVFNYKWLGDVIPDAQNDTSTTGGGDGTGDTSSDDIDFPSIDGLNNTSAVNNGLVNLYKLDNVQMAALGRYMWSDDFVDNLKRLNQSPLDVVISLMSMPIPVGSGNTQNIKLGNLTSTSTGVVIPQYIEVDCGSIYNAGFFGSAMDYAPYTRCEIYLPFCGNHILDIDDVMNKTIHVKYYIDCLSGSCLAIVHVSDANGGVALYNYGGVCASGVPLTYVDRTAKTRAIIEAAVNTATGIAATAAGGGGAMAGVGLVGGMLQSAVDVVTAKNQIQHCGNVSGDASIMNIKKPYLIIERPIQSLPSDYAEIKGYPTNITYTLSQLHGYTEVAAVNLKGFEHATDSELNEINTLLKSGVIL